MSIRAFTADELVDLARNIYAAPDSGTTETEDADLLRRINECYLSTVIGAVYDTWGEYFYTRRRYQLTQGNSRIRIPSRAVWQSFDDVIYWQGSGRRRLSLILSAQARVTEESDSGEPYQFFVEGNYIHLLPSRPDAGEIEIVFPLRPGQLVFAAEARRVTNVNTATGTLTLASIVPASWSTGQKFDVHSSKSGAEVKFFERTPSSVAGVSITFGNVTSPDYGELPVEEGDWVCLEGEAVVPGIPLEMHSILARAGAIALAEGFKDTEAVAIHAANFQAELSRAKDFLVPRVTSQTPVVVGPDFIGMQSRSWCG